MIREKVMLLGDIGVGKSSIARRLIFDKFETEYKTTIGVDILSYEFSVRDNGETRDVQFTLWDTDGDFGDAIFKSVYVKGASAAVIVADLTRPTTIDRLRAISSIFVEQFPGRPYMAVLNKTDLVSADHNENFGADLPADRLHFTSAKNGAGVAAVFEQIALQIIKRT